MSEEQKRSTSADNGEGEGQEQETVHFSVVFDDVDDASAETVPLSPDADGNRPDDDNDQPRHDDGRSDGDDDQPDDDGTGDADDASDAARPHDVTPPSHNGERIEPSDTTHHLAEAIDDELGSRHEDDILLKSYPTFALDHVTVKNPRSGRTLLDDVHLGFHARKLYAVVTSDDEQRVALLGVLGGFNKPDRGQVMLKSADLATLLPGEIRGHRIGLVPQRFALRDDLDATANLVYAMDSTQRTFLKPKPVLAHELLMTVGLDAPAAGEPVGQFSALNQRRVAIARAISCEATAIVIDEPTYDLDEHDGKTILALLAKLAHQGTDARCVVMLTTSDADIDVADRYFEL